MKKRILIVILILLILITISISILKITNQMNQNTKEEQTPLATLTSIKEVQLCIDENNCLTSSKDFYANLKYENNNKETQQWIKKINEETENYYQESINSNTSNQNCSQEIKDIYKHSISIQNIYEVYNGKKYVSLSITRIKKNLCTKEYETIPIKVFLYNQQTKKETTQEQLKKDFNLTDTIIKEKIEENITEINNHTKTNLTIEDTFQNNSLTYTLYINQFGELLASYYQNANNSYYSVIITKIAE